MKRVSSLELFNASMLPLYYTPIQQPFSRSYFTRNDVSSDGSLESEGSFPEQWHEYRLVDTPETLRQGADRV